MPTQALLFDFNGLIIDDEPIHCECTQKALVPEEMELTDTAYWEDYLGFDDKGLFTAVYQSHGQKLTPKKLKELTERKNQFYFETIKKRLPLFDGAKDFVNKVFQHYPLCIVSGALGSEIHYVIETTGIRDAFQFVVSADDTKHGKPDPEGFLMALAKLKKIDNAIRPDGCLVLEDSIAGIEAAKRAGMKVCAMTHTYERDQLVAADYIVDTFSEIEEILKNG